MTFRLFVLSETRQGFGDIPFGICEFLFIKAGYCLFRGPRKVSLAFLGVGLELFSQPFFELLCIHAFDYGTSEHTTVLLKKKIELEAQVSIYAVKWI